MIAEILVFVTQINLKIYQAQDRDMTLNKKFYHFSRFRLSDWVTMSYLIIWIILLIIFYHRIPSAATFLGLHLGVLFTVILLAGLEPETTIVKIVHRWYQFFLVPLFFTALHYLIPVIHPGHIDFELIKIDLFLTGTYPTVWAERFYHPRVTEILQLSYLAFYILGFIVAIPLYVQEKLKEFDRFAFNILLTFYLSYIGYLLFPALGPRFFLSHLQNIPIAGSTLYTSVSHTLNGLENIQWDAFPSGHIAVTLIYSNFLFLYFRKIFYLTFPIVIMLVLSTIYLRYHYLIDIAAGIILFGIVYFIDRKIFQK
jgi:membrane-associated phospholipid phosphatase